MKSPYLAFVLLWLLSTLGLRAVENVSLTNEEVRLIRAFRADPTLFRQVMNENGGGSQVSFGRTVDVIGPRDVIDVSINGGKVQFYGKNHEFEAVSFRISRGETKAITFMKKGAIAETQVVVSFRSDGLHFDIPESYGRTTSVQGGLIVIPESSEWESGSAVTKVGKITALGTASRGENLQISIRYALLARRR